MILTLQHIDPHQSGIPYARWKADQLNRLFLEHGAMRDRARITAATVEHGLIRGHALMQPTKLSQPAKEMR